jgi:hypothetical protein
VHWRRILGEIYHEWLQVCGVKNPKVFGFYFISQQADAQQPDGYVSTRLTQR